MMRLQCQAMALILGELAVKDPAAAAGPVTGLPSSSQDTLETTVKKKEGDSSPAASKEQEAFEAVNT